MSHEIVPTTVILAPGSPENLRASVRRRVPFSALDGHLSEDGILALRESVGDAEGFRCWAVAERNRVLWDGLSARTLVLFFEQGTGELSDEAVPLGKIRSNTLGKALWSEPWPYPFVIGQWRRHRIPKRRFVTELG